jgi:hypothetical protein
MTDEPEITDEDMELGYARAKVNRLCAEIARLRGTSHHVIHTALMNTALWKAQGDPDPKHINLEQARAFIRLLEKWREKAKTQPAKSRHIVSKAPPAPWATKRVAAQEGGQKDGG